MITFIFTLSRPFATYSGSKRSHNGIIQFFQFFCYFSWNFLLGDGLERNGTIIFIFYLSHPSPSYFGLKCSHNGIVLYFEFFYYFFEIMYFASGRNETE